MAVTPLIKPIQNKSGIFYTFQSALEDINITLTHSENAVRFSKFVLLRIPEFGRPNNVQYDNKFGFSNLGETVILEGENNDQNINLAESFQNYALNLEALLISKQEYNREEKLTVAERAFWKWLKESGSIRFRDANSIEKNDAALGSEKRFVEEFIPLGTYKSVVRMIGDIDVVNTIKSKDNSYTEVYIHIPTNAGTTPHVLFKSIKDDNYGPGMIISNSAADPLDIEYLSGRHYYETHPFGLNMNAFYDLDDGSVTIKKKDSYSDAYANGGWFSNTINNSYYTDNYNNTGEYDVARTQWFNKIKGSTDIQYARTTLDGISLDFDLANYKLASENPQIKTFSQFNDYVNNKDFQFNAILIYYDTYDPNNLDSNQNPIDLKTNLYGILFLDKIEQAGTEFSIPYITKYMPDPLNKVNGNAFSFKANLKLDTSIEDVLIEKSVNDFSTFSMDLFLDVLTEFRQIQTHLNDKLIEIEQIKVEMASIKNLLLDTQDLNEISIRLSNVETSLVENQAVFNNTKEVVNMIENINDQLQSILNGQTNLNISYDSDVLRAGDGISLDRRTPNRVKIENTDQDYNIANDSIRNIFTSNVIALSKYSNYIRHENSGNDITLSRDLEIFIDDSTISWKKGQTVRIVFEDKMIPDVSDIKIKTDALNKTGSGVFGKVIGILTDVDFDESGDRPIFEIICVNSETLEFRIDKIR